MNKSVLTFIFGAFSGSVVTYFVLKKRIEKKCQENADAQIDDVKRSLKKFYEKEPSNARHSEFEKEEQDIGIDEKVSDMGVRILKNGQREFLGFNKTVPNAEVTEPDHNVYREPYVIEESEFGAIYDDYCEWALWSDGTVTSDDMMCEKIDPKIVKDTLPEDWRKKFGWDGLGKYNDILYFRNDREKIDVQIIKNDRSYSEWLKEAFPLRADEADG